MEGPDYRTAAEYWRDRKWAERRVWLDGAGDEHDDEPQDEERVVDSGECRAWARATS